MATANAAAAGRSIISKNTPVDLAQLERIAKGLDAQFRIPGTPIRFGWESIVGLVPVVGDSATGVISLWIILQAWRAGAGKGLLARMALNVLVDVSIGAIPLAGDVFDMFFKGNLRNVRLLRKHLRKAT